MQCLQRFSIKLDESLYSYLEKRADEEGKSLPEMIETVLSQEMKRALAIEEWNRRVADAQR